ncbi:hypothetical protein ACLMJK_002056 [Lecanora helva]
MAIEKSDTSTTASTSISARLQTQVPSTYLNLPSQWISSYNSFVKANAAQVSQIESGLRSLTYIIPGRFHDAPLASESLQTFLSLLTAYNTHLLPSPSPPSPAARYQHFCKLASPLYARCAALLRTIQYTQLLCEMFAKRAGEKVRWRVVVVLEIVKALLRLLMGRASGNRTLVETGVGDERQDRRVDDDRGALSVEAAEAETGDWKMPRTGMRLPQLPLPSGVSGENITDFLGKRVISADEIKSENRLVRRITSAQGQIAEIMWVLRPVMYALALQRYQTNKRDWRPWAIGLAMEVASRQFAKKDVKESVVGGMRALSGVEKEELSRRGWGMAWWGMRGAFYENITREYIRGFAGKLKGKPLLDLVGVIVEDYDYLWDEYYFSTATL